MAVLSIMDAGEIQKVPASIDEAISLATGVIPNPAQFSRMRDLACSGRIQGPASLPLHAGSFA
jgi:hypothetical protein